MIFLILMILSLQLTYALIICVQSSTLIRSQSRKGNQYENVTADRMMNAHLTDNASSPRLSTSVKSQRLLFEILDYPDKKVLLNKLKLGYICFCIFVFSFFFRLWS